MLRNEALYLEYQRKINPLNERSLHLRVALYHALLRDSSLLPQIKPLLELNEEQFTTLTQSQDNHVWINAFGPNSAKIIDLAPPSYQPRVQQIEIIETRIEGEKNAFFREDHIKEAYSNTVVNPGYYLSDKELEISAYLYEKRVILFSETQAPQVFNDQGAETVAIEHRGAHYSRLEPR